MKKPLLVLAFLFTVSFVQAQTKDFDIISPFKLWLLNNEARVFSSLSSDEMLISKVSTPFAFMPAGQPVFARAEEKLWETHRKIYALLDDAQSIYSIARRFGSGRFSVILKQARPEIWALLPIHMVRPGILNILSVDYRKAFHNTLLKCLQLDSSRDLDLSRRLNSAIKKLSDEEYRLLNDYFATFAALFPGESSVRMIKAFLDSGSRKPFAIGIKELLKPTFSAPVFADVIVATATAQPDDPLAELEKLAQFEEGGSIDTPAAETGNAETSQEPGNENPKPASPATLEPPPPGTEDLFNIWD